MSFLPDDFDEEEEEEEDDLDLFLSTGWVGAGASYFLTLIYPEAVYFFAMLSSLLLIILIASLYKGIVALLILPSLESITFDIYWAS